MKKAHFQYVGYPRSGSTFLYRIFQRQAQLQECTNNFIKEFYCNDLGTYKNTYCKFDYSINMYTTTLIRRRTEYLETTNSVTDKFFACLRNPYDAFSSSFALWNGHGHPDFLKYRFAECAENLQLAQHAITKPFKIFYFEDLVDNEKKFLSDVCNFLEIETPEVDTNLILKHTSKEVYHDVNKCNSVLAVGGPVSIRNPTDVVPQYTFSDSDIEYFNQKITELEQYLDRDFSHWKR